MQNQNSSSPSSPNDSNRLVFSFCLGFFDFSSSSFLALLCSKGRFKPDGFVAELFSSRALSPFVLVCSSVFLTGFLNRIFAGLTGREESFAN